MLLLSGPDSTEKTQLWMDQHCKRARVSDGKQEENVFMRYICDIYAIYIYICDLYICDISKVGIIPSMFRCQCTTTWGNCRVGSQRRTVPQRQDFTSFDPKNNDILSELVWKEPWLLCSEWRCWVSGQVPNSNIHIWNKEKWKNGHTSH